MKKHLAIVTKEAAEAILSGRKTIETRFSLHRIPPFGMVSAGDVVFVKPSGEDLIGQFRVKKVISYDGLTNQDLELIWQTYGQQIGTGDEKWDFTYFQSKKNCRFGTLIFINNSERFITSPIKIKKHDRRGWIVIE